MTLWVPRVFDTSGTTEREYDLFSRLLIDRIIFLGTDIDDRSANLVVAQLLFLQSEKKDQDINLYINSPGGDITAGLAIYDTMQFVQCDVATYGIGTAGSMAAVLLSAGAAGKRFALPHAQIMIHQPWGSVRGTAEDIVIHAREIAANRRTLEAILSRHTGRDLAQIPKDTNRDHYFSAEEAKAYGLVDEVITSVEEGASQTKER
jgi:ATP-dependent Clp protease protease subunit